MIREARQTDMDAIMQVISEGFKPYKSEKVGPGLTWAYLEK